MRIEGQIQLDESGRIMVDAEPHVMGRIRSVFDNADSWYRQGKYTHKPILFSFNRSAAKDILWIMSRYNLECETSLLASIKEKSAEYDRIQSQVANADKDTSYRVSPNALPVGIPLRTHQIQFKNMFSQMKRMLLADKLGLGKTGSALATLQEPESRPALIVVPPHLCSQWEREAKRFLPGATTHVIRGFKNYELPKVDILITSYNRLSPWQDKLLESPKYFKSLIFDEVHELRHTGTAKRNLCRILSERVGYCCGLSGTPIYNYGSEIWSVMDAIHPEALGGEDEFLSEWANWGKIREPSVLNHFLKTQGMMLRRTPEDIGLSFGTASKQVYTLDADIQSLENVQNVAKMLAMSVLSGNINEQSESAREFDWKLRHATGVAKAKPTAEFVKLLAEQGEKVLLVGWHRDVYSVWEKELKHLNPVFYTGTETPAQKDKAVKEFIEGNAQVFVISMGSGAGLDGLQRVCNVVVFGELAWSPHVMDQVVGRLDRDGQIKHVQAFYLTIPDGSDPFMIEILSKKRSQHDGVIEGKTGEAEILESSGSGNDRIKEMAKSYLSSIGEEIPESVEETGLLAEVATALRSVKVPLSSEEEMQMGLWSVLPGLLPHATVEREVKISKRSRLDFLVSNGVEKVAIECKINSTKRAEVYRQVRRYVEDGGATSVVVFAPWFGIGSFKVDETPVVVVDTGTQAI